MKSTTKPCALALVTLLLGALVGISSVGCQSSVRMTRPDIDASLSRPDDWPRERSEEAAGVLFQMRHPVQPVRVRLQRLENPIIKQAHDSWARLWLAETFDEVTVEAAQPASVGGNQALELVSRATDDGDELTHELVLANAGGQTYLLESWGGPDAMEKTSIERRQIVESLALPPAAGAPAPSPAKRVELSGDGFRVVLPAFQTAPINANWQVDRPSDRRIVFELPSHLIEGEVLAESLDYPIDAVTYAETALDIDVNNGGDDDDMADADGVTIRGVTDGSGAVEIHTTRRFITSGERAVQIVVSTPEALYETNSDVIDALVETLEVVEAAE
jgi:hypothetical protein